MDKKDNTVLIRLSDEELCKLNDGWFKAVALEGRPKTKSQYLRDCINAMYEYNKARYRGEV